nr:hypothetical protein [Eubacterium sp.]
MNIQSWITGQGSPTSATTRKSIETAGKKQSALSQGTGKKEKEKDSYWDLLTESYEPSQKAEEYKKKLEKVEATKPNKSEDVPLSDNAKKLLEELKEKYSNMDFFVASYSTEEEAQRYLRQGTKEYSVLIDPETLEAMAADAEVRKKYEDILAGAGDKLEELKEKLGEDADKVEHFGIVIDQTGTVSYFAELDKLSESRKEQLEAAKEKKAQEKKEKERAEEKRNAKDKEDFVKANSMDELVEKIQERVAAWEVQVPEGGFDIVM